VYINFLYLYLIFIFTNIIHLNKTGLYKIRSNKTREWRYYMKFSKKLLLTQVVALAASSAAFADSKAPDYIASGNSVLAPMVSDGVNGLGVNNELFLLSQKQNGALKDGVVYVNGRLNVAVDYNQSSPGSQSAVLIPGVDLAFTATKGWFTAFADLSNNKLSNSVYWSQSVISGAGFGTPIITSNGAKIYNNYGSSINLSQGFLMLGDLSKMPVYMLVGKKYVDFGSFANQSQTWQPLTNVFNQDRQTQVAAGFYTHGFHGAVTLFRAPWTSNTPTGILNATAGYQSQQLSTMAATLSYGTSINKFGLHGGISYTTNMNPADTGLSIVVDGIMAEPGLNGYHAGNNNNRVAAGIIFAEVNFNPVTITGSYASAMRAVETSTILSPSPQGKPSAWDIGAKFNFNLMNRANWLSVNYSSSQTRGWTENVLGAAVSKNTNQTSKQWLFGWNMQVSRDIDATFQYGHLLHTSKPNTNVFALGANLYF
jgi:hypothetical protein